MAQEEEKVEEKRGKGRPKGAVSPEKKAQQKAFEDMKKKILRSQNALLRAQIGVAKGLTFLYVIRKGSKKPQVVTDVEIIEAYLADELENDEDEYYFMSTKEPDTKAIDSLIDRVHGKARQNIGLDGGDDDKPIAIKSVEEDLREWATKK